MALGLLAEGAAADAAAAARAAVEADPGFPAAWFTLGEAAERAGEAAAAEAAFRQYLALEPDDRMGAGAHLVQLGLAATPERLPAAYVRALFDDYAPRFEQSLRGRLGYCGPEALGALLAAAVPGRRFASALDLGCGTGLMGAVLRPLAARLTGLDLSPRMLARAREKGLYDTLLAGDLAALLPAEAGRHDLVAAADVLPYLGALPPLLAAIAAALRPGGLFLATLERADDAALRLLPTQRFAHGEGYLRSALADAGLVPRTLTQGSIRQERGQPVPGWLLLAAAGG